MGCGCNKNRANRLGNAIAKTRVNTNARNPNSPAKVVKQSMTRSNFLDTYKKRIERLKQNAIKSKFKS